MSSILTYAGKDINTRIYDLVSKNGCTFLEAVMDVCEQLNIEPEALKEKLNKQVRERLFEEFENRNMIKKSYRKNKKESVDLNEFVE